MTRDMEENGTFRGNVIKTVLKSVIAGKKLSNGRENSGFPFHTG
jgi:hypothetical protein